MRETREDIQVSPEWPRLLAAVTARPGGGRIGVLGETGSGKSTLVAWLGRALAERAPSGRLDADPGQGRIGPPATVALGREPHPEDRPEAVCFVGAVSPDHHLLSMMAGVARLARRSRQMGCEWLVMDSTGFLDFPAGRELHHRLIEVLDLDHLVVVDGAALAAVLSPLRRRVRPEVHEVPPSPNVVERSRAERRAYRASRFRLALKGARPLVVPAEVAVHGHEPGSEDGWAGLLVGLLDREGFLLRLGVARDQSVAGLTVLVPPVDLDAVASVEVGTGRFDLDHVRNLHP